MRITLMAAVTLFSALSAVFVAETAYAAGAVPEASRPHGVPLCTRCGGLDGFHSSGSPLERNRSAISPVMSTERAAGRAITDGSLTHRSNVSLQVKVSPTAAIRHERVSVRLPISPTNRNLRQRITLRHPHVVPRPPSAP
jgi:hypothetical protein